jgi:predicted regulator of amino acid metabolism with ACT domain
MKKIRSLLIAGSMLAAPGCSEGPDELKVEDRRSGAIGLCAAVAIDAAILRRETSSNEVQDREAFTAFCADISVSAEHIKQNGELDRAATMNAFDELMNDPELDKILNTAYDIAEFRQTEGRMPKITDEVGFTSSDIAICGLVYTGRPEIPSVSDSVAACAEELGIPFKDPIVDEAKRLVDAIFIIMEQNAAQQTTEAVIIG